MNIPSPGLTSHQRVFRNLLDDAFFLLLTEIKIHGCSQHQVTLEQKANASKTHFQKTMSYWITIHLTLTKCLACSSYFFSSSFL